MRSFWTKVDALEAWHAKACRQAVAAASQAYQICGCLIILSTLIAAGMNWYVRHWQYQVWEQNPEIFYLDDGTPLFTTTDAPYFLGVAKAIKMVTIQDFVKSDYTQIIKHSGFRKICLKVACSISSSVCFNFCTFCRWLTKRACLITGNALIPITVNTNNIDDCFCVWCCRILA